MVGVLGIEPRASRSQSGRATAAPHPDVTDPAIVASQLAMSLAERRQSSATLFALWHRDGL